MDTNKNKDSFLKGALILGVAGVIIKILGAFFRIPLANMIGSSGMGYYQAAYPVYTLFFTLATAGFPTAVAKLVSEKVAIKDNRGAVKIFKVSRSILLMTGIIAFLILFFGSSVIVNDIMKNPNAYYSMKAIAPALLFVPVMSAYRGFFQGKRDMTKVALSQIVEQIVRVFLGLYLAYILYKASGAEYGAAGAISGATIGSAASLIFLILIYALGTKNRKRESLEGAKFKEESFSTILKNLLVVTIPITIGACVMPLVNMMDTVIVVRRLQAAGFTYMMANSMLGQLTGMAMTIVNMPSVITTALSMSLVPAIAASYALGNKAKARKDTKTAIKVTLMIVLPCAFGMAALATPIMHLLYPREPAGLGVILFTVAPCCIFLGLIQTTNGILQGMGKPIVPVVSLIIGMMCKIIISYTLTGIHDINILGSGLGTVTAYLVAASINIVYIMRKMNLKLSKMEFIIKPLITVITMYIMAKLSYGVVSNVLGNSLSTVVAICVGGLVYVLVVLGIGAISEDEIHAMPKGDKIYKILKRTKLVRR
ncbi:MAG: polysaccharide biosynthesis protein [Clostridioides sp.]|jgi:stage V sporulation protein B|nr:polysaccharide biosynthesis protein [Clostridioides sp.]